jgi:Ca-activated chloride channel family protein
MKTIIFTALFFLVLGDCPAQTERSLVRDGNRSYSDTKYADAEVNYRKALEKNKESQTGVFNLGDALYKQGRYAEAAQQYAMTASRTHDKDVKAKAYHNLGNTFMKVQDYEKSIEAYKEALKTNPEDPDTKYNYEYARAMLQQQQQQQKQQQKNDKQDKNKDNNKQKQSDQQNKDQQNKDQQNKDQQNKQDQAQNQQQKDQQKAQQDKTQTAAKKQQISKEDAERILQALNNEEKDVQKKLHKKVPVRVKIDKDW